MGLLHHRRLGRLDEGIFVSWGRISLRARYCLRQRHKSYFTGREETWYSLLLL